MGSDRQDPQVENEGVPGGDTDKPARETMAGIRRQVEERIRAEREGREPEGREPEGRDEDAEKKWLKFVAECFRSNELGDGVLYNTLHRGRFVFVKSLDTWLVWRGHCWAMDEMSEAQAAVENVVIQYQKLDADAGKKLKEMRSKGEDAPEKAVKAMERFRESIKKRISALRSIRRRNNCLTAAHTCEKPLAIHGRELDQNAWLLPCANGVIDLKTGELRDGDPDQYMLRASPVEYRGIEDSRETWERTLLDIFEEDESMTEFIQRLFGAAIVGGVYEHIFPVLTGPGGRNGKSTILETLAQVMGPLAGPIRAEMLLDTYQVASSSGPTPDIMSLRGLRIAWASETKDGVKLSMSKVKWLTGDDMLTGRSPHDKYETTFHPTHTLFLISNYKPQSDANDKAFSERILNVPFNVRFLKNREPAEDNERRADPFLKEKLAAEASGILGWLVEGCLMWQLDGLQPPPKVRAETDEYLSDQDNYSAFVDYCLVTGEGLSIGATDLYDAFEYWWRRYVNRFPPRQKKFGKHMKELFESGRGTGGVYRYYGVALNPEWEEIMAEKSGG